MKTILRGNKTSHSPKGNKEDNTVLPCFLGWVRFYLPTSYWANNHLSFLCKTATQVIVCFCYWMINKAFSKRPVDCWTSMEGGRSVKRAAVLVSTHNCPCGCALRKAARSLGDAMPVSKLKKSTHIVPR